MCLLRFDRYAHGCFYKHNRYRTSITLKIGTFCNDKCMCANFHTQNIVSTFIFSSQSTKMKMFLLGSSLWCVVFCLICPFQIMCELFTQAVVMSPATVCILFQWVWLPSVFLKPDFGAKQGAELANVSALEKLMV